MNLIGACFEDMGEIMQAIHGHPRAVGAADTGGPLSASGGLDKGFSWRSLTHLVKDTSVCSDDEFVVRKILGGLDQGRG